jgi:hypothetical protein
VKRNFAPAFALCGAWSQLILLGGLLVSLFKLHQLSGMVDLSDQVKVEKVIASIERSTQEAGRAFDPLLWSFLAAMLLLTLFFVAVMKLGYRRPWAFYFSLIYGIVLLSLIPIGLPFGLLLVIYALRHHRGFFALPITAATPTKA